MKTNFTGIRWTSGPFFQLDKFFLHLWWHCGWERRGSPVRSKSGSTSPRLQPALPPVRDPQSSASPGFRCSCHPTAPKILLGMFKKSQSRRRNPDPIIPPSCRFSY